MLTYPSDEILYHAKLHPEQYSNTFSPEQLKTLHSSILHICGTAVDLLADASKFPDDWLFSHRWGKGKKDGTKTLPSGEKIIFLTVGGRTSCVVPSRQKKTGPVAPNIEVEADEDVPEIVKAELKSSADESEGGDAKKKTNKKTQSKNVKDENNKPAVSAVRTNGVRKAKRPAKSENEDDEASDVKTTATNRKRRKADSDVAEDTANVGKRRSARLSSG